MEKVKGYLKTIDLLVIYIYQLYLFYLQSFFSLPVSRLIFLPGVTIMIRSIFYLFEILSPFVSGDFSTVRSGE